MTTVICSHITAACYDLGINPWNGETITCCHATWHESAPVYWPMLYCHIAGGKRNCIIPRQHAARLRAEPGHHPSSRRGTVALLLGLLPVTATIEDVEEVLAGLEPPGAGVAWGFVAEVLDKRPGVV